MRTVVFINAHARRASRHLLAVRDFFDHHPTFKVIDYIVVEDLQSFEVALNRLRSYKQAQCVIVGGGDGTVMSVLNKLKGRKNLIYGFLPLGTTNVYARNLGLPLSVKKCLHVLARHNAQLVNLGSVNGTLFLSTADIGLSVQVVKELNNRTKHVLGPIAYYLFALGILIRYKPLACELQIGSEKIKVRTYDLAIVNGRYYGPVIAAKSGSVFEDTFTILYGHNQSRFDFVHGVNKLAVGREDKRRNIFSISTSHLVLKTEKPQDIQADGEIVGKTPAEIKIIKNAIRVLAPPQK